MIFRTLKNIFFWGYARNTWQYDVLCVLILCFIFLTPRNWFGHGELMSRAGHLNSVAPTRLLIGAETLSAQPDNTEIEQRARQLTNRPQLRIKNQQPIKDAGGKTIAFEVEIQ
ncbi:MAG: hypothetical protein ABR577_04925 [Pyrinomonadaceae bacterium]